MYSGQNSPYQVRPLVDPYLAPQYQNVHEANVIIQNQSGQITLLENKIRGITGDINTINANIQIRNQEIEDIQHQYNNSQQVLNQNMFRVRELESTVDHLKEDYQNILLHCDDKENELFQLNQEFITKTREMKNYRNQSDQYDNVQGFILDLQNKLRQQELEYNRLRLNVQQTQQQLLNTHLNSTAKKQ